ncbi:hypothetical protein GOBAR_AA32623 [Gossypium barbadense]|uniref:Thaumatin-like protein n=1 Tax=Gossypium barbadense TaxID=3634 RepID=A0A2P5WAI8_GOSBA|nr:hypothetical protein GOBAR_AA32623 [Gossypium barbadense]
MSYLTISQISSILFFSVLFISAHAARFEIRNECPYTVWAAASPGGGRRLDPWQISMPVVGVIARPAIVVDSFNVKLMGLTSPWCLVQLMAVVTTFGALLDINGQCPNELRAPGGCNNPCAVFKTNEYCCTQGYSRFFKDRCGDSYSYPQDDPSSTFTCPAGSNYRVVFCPRGSPRIEMVGSKNQEK